MISRDTALLVTKQKVVSADDICFYYLLLESRRVFKRIC